MPTPTGSPPPAWRLAVGAVLGPLARVFGWRVRTTQPATIPRNGTPLLVVFNHTSALDAFLVAGVIKRKLGRWCRPLVKAELCNAPVVGAIARNAGAIPVERSTDASRDNAYAVAVEQLRNGQTVMIAPEATITHDGALLPLRHGAARLALEADVDILVATQFGSQRGFSPVAKLPHRDATVTMAFDMVRPWANEDASTLTGRIAAIMIDRMTQLRDEYPEQATDAPWWPPYPTPASPSAVARDSLKRYRDSMTETIEQARERMAQVAADHSLDERVERAKHRASEVAEGARQHAHAFGEQAREKSEALTDQAREKTEALTEQARARAEAFTEHARERVDELTEQARTKSEALTEQTRTRVDEIIEARKRGGDAEHPPDGPDDQDASDHSDGSD